MLSAGGTSNVYGAPLATLIVRAVRNLQGASVRITTDNDAIASGTSESIAEEVGSLPRDSGAGPGPHRLSKVVFHHSVGESVSR